MSQATLVKTAQVFDIAYELDNLDSVTKSRLNIQNKNIGTVSAHVIAKEHENLENIEHNKVSPLTQRIIDHMLTKHLEFNEMLVEKLEQGKITKESYIRYLIQAWYHTRYTPEFEAKFGEKLAEYIKSKTSTQFEKGNKFIMLVEAGVDEEAGHELWAIQDLQKLGVTHFDKVNDVFAESKALIATQFDRLNRLNFKGFLGYSFYLEFWVAKYSEFQLELLTSQGFDRTCQSFIYNHYVVDQGHAQDNIELLNFLIETEDDLEEVIENMDIIHLLYSGIVNKAFS
jgi:hypothetical protein